MSFLKLIAIIGISFSGLIVSSNALYSLFGKTILSGIFGVFVFFSFAYLTSEFFLKTSFKEQGK